MFKSGTIPYNNIFHIYYQVSRNNNFIYVSLCIFKLQYLLFVFYKLQRKNFNNKNIAQHL